MARTIQTYIEKMKSALVIVSKKIPIATPLLWRFSMFFSIYKFMEKLNCDGFEWDFHYWQGKVLATTTVKQYFNEKFFQLSKTNNMCQNLTKN